LVARPLNLVDQPVVVTTGFQRDLGIGWQLPQKAPVLLSGVLHPNCGTPRWRPRGCAFCSLPPRSGATPAAPAWATAITTRRRDCFSGWWIGCAGLCRAGKATPRWCTRPWG